MHYKEYIDEDPNKAVKKVFSNSGPYEKLHEALRRIATKKPDLFDIETIAKAGEKKLAEILIGNKLFVSFKDGNMQVEDRDKLDIDKVELYLSEALRFR